MAFDFGTTIDKIQELDEKASVIMTAAASKAKPFSDEAAQLKELLEAAMNDANLAEVKGPKSGAKAKISETLRVSIEDYSALEQLVYRKKLLHLFERRVSTKAYAELKASLGNKPVPGLKEFLQARLSITKAK